MSSTFVLTCPNCSYRIRASSEHIGRTGRCPNCKTLVEIRGAPSDGVMAPLPTASAKAAAKAGTTDVPPWIAAVLGAVGAVILYAMLWPMQHLTFASKFFTGGLITPLESILFCWGLAILGLKYLAAKRQLSYAELELQFIPLEIGLQITPTNVDQFLNHVGKLPTEQRFSILGRRISGALEHFKSRNNVSEVQTYLATKAEIDSSSVNSGYTLLKAFIWAIPILGFIGTVYGLGTAVQGLKLATQSPVAQTTASGETAEVPSTEETQKNLQTAMTSVTGGLDAAFDTTLIALIMAIILLFPMESLRRTEYAMLDRIEQFANESLLRRLSDESAGPDLESMPDVVRHALESAFQQHQRWLAQWQAQVAQLGQAVGADFERAVLRIRDQLEQADAARTAQYQNLTRIMDELFGKSGESNRAWQQAGQQIESRAESLGQLVQRVDQEFTAAMEKWADMSQQLAVTPGNGATAAFETVLVRLERQMERLSQAMERPVPAPTMATVLATNDNSEVTLHADESKPRRRMWPWK